MCHLQITTSIINRFATYYKVSQQEDAEEEQEQQLLSLLTAMLEVKIDKQILFTLILACHGIGL